ncbi:MAG: SRPBCC domain-containing protein [Candidatus Delongbacteria bacterium]
MSTFHTTRELAAAPEALFDAIREPARLARWWGPAGFTNTFQVFEFQAGGAWRFTMHGPDGKDYVNEAAFLEIIPNALVKIQHLNLPHFELTLALEPSATGTRLGWVAEFEDHEFAERLREFLEGANEENLDRLELELRRGAASTV